MCDIRKIHHVKARNHVLRLGGGGAGAAGCTRTGAAGLRAAAAFSPDAFVLASLPWQVARV